MLQILRKSLVHRRNIECCNSGFRHKCAVSGYKGAQKIMTCKTGLKPKSFEKFSSEFSPESMNPINKIDHTMPFPGLDT